MCPIEDSRGGVDGGALDVSIVSIAVWLAVRYMTPCVCMWCRKTIIFELELARFLFVGIREDTIQYHGGLRSRE